jgi:hypothetical protein
MRLVKNDDGSWRSWDSSIDDCMDHVETMDVVEIQREDARLISYRVYFGQINQICIGVTARNEDEARENAHYEWKKHWSKPDVMSVERCK